METQSSCLIVTLLSCFTVAFVQRTGKEIVESISNDKWVIGQDKSNCTTPKSCVVDAKYHQFDFLATLSDGGSMFGSALAISER